MTWLSNREGSVHLSRKAPDGRHVFESGRSIEFRQRQQSLLSGHARHKVQLRF